MLPRLPNFDLKPAILKLKYSSVESQVIVRIAAVLDVFNITSTMLAAKGFIRTYASTYIILLYV